MPYQVQSNYPAGASTTSASGGGGNPYFDALLARENQALLAQQALRNGTMTASAQPAGRGGFGANPGRQAPVDPSLFTGPSQMEKLQLQQAQIKTQDMLEALKARRTPPPMKPVTGFNMLGGPEGRDILQTNMLNAYQREAYLPGGSAIVDPGTAVPTGSIKSPKILHGVGG